MDVLKSIEEHKRAGRPIHETDFNHFTMCRAWIGDVRVRWYESSGAGIFGYRKESLTEERA
jgi:hypothetical protein